MYQQIKLKEMRRIVLFLGVQALLFSACSHKQKSVTEDSLSVPVKTHIVAGKELNTVIALSGNVEGIKTIRLGFLVAGKVNQVAVSEGDMIQKGAFIASLDPESYALAKDIADASLNQVQDDYNRLSKMHETNSVTESDYSKISNGYLQANANQKLQTKNLSDTKMYAPISGVVLKKGVEVGEIIGSGMALFAISNIDKVKINAALPEKELHKVKLNQIADIYVAALDSTVTGKIIEIGAVAEPTTRSFAIKIEVNNNEKLLRPGMIAEIRIRSVETKYTTLLPIEAILHDVDNQPYIFVIDPKLNKSFKRKVRLGSILNNQIEATSGIKSGELVVIGGHQRLNDGTSVILK